MVERVLWCEEIRSQPLTQKQTPNLYFGSAVHFFLGGGNCKTDIPDDYKLWTSTAESEAKKTDKANRRAWNALSNSNHSICFCFAVLVSSLLFSSLAVVMEHTVLAEASLLLFVQLCVSYLVPMTLSQPR